MNDVIVKFANVNIQTVGSVDRIIGYVEIHNLIPLITHLDLDANPRNSKIGSVTEQIQESLERTPELMPFKSKGILVAASKCDQLERNRFSLNFDNQQIEGVLDGGHNLLAIGRFLLWQVLDRKDEAEFKRRKKWLEFKELWARYADKLDKLRRQGVSGGTTPTLISVELLTPTMNGTKDGAAEDFFLSNLLEICAARNNNVQLSEETTMNQQGLFEVLRESLPSEVAEEVQWKQNGPGSIAARDVVALAWVALGVIDLPNDEDGKAILPLPGPTLYSRKAQCVSEYARLLRAPDVSCSKPEGYKVTVADSRILQALNMTRDVLWAWDWFYAALPDSYNRAGGKYGRISAVKKAASGRGTPYGMVDKKCTYDTPAGFLMPLVYSLRSLIEVDDQGCPQWAVANIRQYIIDHTDELVVDLRAQIESLGWRPMDVGKSKASYNSMENKMKTLLLTEQLKQRG
ncbi:MAG: hypothetical protein E7A62_08500 [Actinomycetaceae bacterium]|nr:hypothetical protein [Actinomycetaceae bacterium]MDU0971015.1 hypothetical protein [Actinomycetaceae bacterium]